MIGLNNRLAGTIENRTYLNLALDFVQSVFDKIKTGLGFQIRASFRSKNWNFPDRFNFDGRHRYRGVNGKRKE